jgi:DnaJ-class molecular chaperone
MTTEATCDPCKGTGRVQTSEGSQVCEACLGVGSVKVRPLAKGRTDIRDLGEGVSDFLDGRPGGDAPDSYARARRGAKG